MDYIALMRERRDNLRQAVAAADSFLADARTELDLLEHFLANFTTPANLDVFPALTSGPVDGEPDPPPVVEPLSGGLAELLASRVEYDGSLLQGCNSNHDACVALATPNGGLLRTSEAGELMMKENFSKARSMSSMTATLHNALLGKEHWLHVCPGVWLFLPAVSTQVMVDLQSEGKVLEPVSGCLPESEDISEQEQTSILLEHGSDIAA